MKVLVLINAAQEHRPFYSRVGGELERQGFEVHYALDSHYSDYLHPDKGLGGRAHYFSEYFAQHYDRDALPDEFRDVPIGTLLYPDVERMMHTRFLKWPAEKYYPSLVANLAYFFLDLFDAYQFDSIVYENVSNAFSYFAFEVGKQRGARFVGFAMSRMPNRLDILDRAWARNSALEPQFWRIKREQCMTTETRAFVDDYLAHFNDKVPDYIRNPHPFQMGLIARYARSASALRFLRSLRYAISEPEDLRYAFQVANPFFVFPEQFGREVMRNAKRKILERTLYQLDVDLDAPYVAYALQFHPESSASVDGPAFSDEWYNVQQIARCLPAGVRLYVKDHRHAAGRQPLSFYERVARIPNVVLIHPNYDTKALLRRARIVIVCTSTMGFEALLLRRPVVVLGHPFYEFVPGVHRLHSFDEAEQVLARVLSSEPAPSQEDVEAFLGAYFDTTEPGSLDVTQQYNDQETVGWIAGVVARATREHVSRRSSSSITPQAEIA